MLIQMVNAGGFEWFRITTEPAAAVEVGNALTVVRQS